MRPVAVTIGMVAIALLMGCSDVFRSSYDYARIVVRVSDEHGDPVQGAPLTLYTGTMHMAYGTTRADGRYSFDFVPAGGYGIATRPPPRYRWPGGSVPYRIVGVEKGNEYTVDFHFELAPP